MKSLQMQMDKFSKSMEMTKVNSTDLTASLKNMEKSQPFQQMMESPVQQGQLAGGGGGQTNNVTVNLKIDVSGVTDKTDKQKLAKEISTMVTKELRSKIGGSFTQSGFNRSGYMDEGERMSIRLVQENGDTISLDATQVDIVVERVQSNFGIPLMDAKRMGIDVNQSAVTVEVQGVFADDLGQEESSQATAILDFYQPQQIVTWGQPVGGSGGNPSGPISSGFNSRGSSGGVGATTGLTGTIANSGSFSGGIGGSLGGGVTDLNDLGNRILKYWNLKYIDFPVAYWIEESGELTVPVSSGMQLWLKADAITNTDRSVLPTWNDSSGNGGLAQQLDATKQPKYRTNGINGKPYVQFDGSNDFMEIAYSAFFNSEEFTVFAVAKTDATAGDQPVFSSIEGTTGGSNAKGYAQIQRCEH